MSDSKLPEARQVTVEFEEMGTQLARANDLGNPVKHEIMQMADMVLHQFRTYIAGGAPRTVTVSAKAPAGWWQHVLFDLSNNALNKSYTNLGVKFGLWLAGKVKFDTVSNREDVNRNICPHINQPSHHQKHVQFLAREV